MAWKFNRNAPLFLQIADRIRGDILRGVYAPDEQIKAVRQIAVEVAVNPNTVQKSLTLLEEEGLLYTKGTAGRFVTSDVGILSRTRARVAREMAHHICEEAEALGLSRDKLIDYIKKEKIRDD